MVNKNKPISEVEIKKLKDIRLNRKPTLIEALSDAPNVEKVREIVKEVEDNVGRYNCFSVYIITDGGLINTDFCCDITAKVFERYKIGYLMELKTVHVIGYCSIRKRIPTIFNSLESVFKEQVIEGVIPDYEASTYSIDVKRAKGSFDSLIPEGEFILGDGSSLAYFGEDVKLLESNEQRFPWQNKLLETIFDIDKKKFLDPDDRTIIWIYDSKGCTGKSKFVKWMCVNHPEEVTKIIFGTSGQLRSSFISAGIKICYFLDIPRTKGNDDSIECIISAIEDLKNGHLVTNFYGKYKQLLMNPPHVIVFSNDKCPKELMSQDRWLKFEIKNNQLKKM
jgi:hypothetical protein